MTTGILDLCIILVLFVLSSYLLLIGLSTFEKAEKYKYRARIYKKLEKESYLIIGMALVILFMAYYFVMIVFTQPLI